MLLLHGYLSCKESFYYQINALSKYYRVTAPDILGFGKSGAIPFAYSVSDYASWLALFIEKAGINKPNILAHSFGARVAIKYVSSHPERVKKLIITGGAGVVKPRSPQYMRRVNAYRRIKKIFPAYAEKHFGSSEYRTLSPVMRESYKSIVNEDLRAEASAISVPTLLIYGRQDTVTPPDEEGAIFANVIPSSRLEVIDGGHFCFCENKDRFNNLVYTFLSG